MSLILAGLTQQVFHLMLMRSFPHFIFSSVSFIGTVGEYKSVISLFGVGPMRPNLINLASMSVVTRLTIKM